MWDVETRKCIHAFEDTNHLALTSVAFSPDGTCIAAGGHDKAIKVWDVRTNSLIQYYASHTRSVNEVAFHPSGNFLVSASQDATVKVRGGWPVRTSQDATVKVSWLLLSSLHYCICPRSSVLGLGIGQHGFATPWGYRTNCAGHPPRRSGEATLSFSLRSRHRTVSSSMAFQRTTALRGRINLSCPPKRTGPLQSALDMPPNARSAQVWDLREGQLMYTLHAHEGCTNSVGFSPAGDYFASAGVDEQVMVWRTNFDRNLTNYVLTDVERHVLGPEVVPSESKVPRPFAFSCSIGSALFLCSLFSRLLNVLNTDVFSMSSPLMSSLSLPTPLSASFMSPTLVQSLCRSSLPLFLHFSHLLHLSSLSFLPRASPTLPLVSLTLLLPPPLHSRSPTTPTPTQMRPPSRPVAGKGRGAACLP